ncbi:cytochrome b556-binding succinate dehydrogenase membrane subunit [Wigglesworthia glossinidia endosymbiont of Glossina morsitans morsitans (Yale colony)]|uniref:Succinate dehydrogenase hydrophobic membrane anchor subunit n=1 Tax=Wigglesworthia glossinidia endosymbiont of Glossina morsitans morsitans (Yale colony) TaxID=1142511 RepID=H6Q5X9_WIGGL|nr:succinate dehydrogenase, hydrophobic membrane anchor protein [Wigglesworthia glossinidia]AFA41175.1 cytochrome b556-binding succinate dehydrogenase membrane subunit [Wigglesworthia glossinidia endosymbiont of Glossina morsitans morsitans (Yale colony)]
MVKKTSAFGLPGIYEWLLLRISGLLIFLYILCIIVFIICNTPINYVKWHCFFDKKTIKIFTILVFLSVAIHGWIGMWQVVTDYVKPKFMRTTVQLIICAILLFYLIYGIKIIM